MPVTDVLADLTPQVEPAREHHWEGVFELHADGDHFVFNAVARLTLQSGLLEGAGNATLAEEPSMAPAEFSLAGERSGDAVSFRFWFQEDLLAHPFECNGTLDADERLMEGNWAYECIDPVGCNCTGGSGPFRLERVSD